MKHWLKAVACLRIFSQRCAYKGLLVSVGWGGTWLTQGGTFKCFVFCTRLTTIPQLPTPSNYVIQDTRGSHLPGAACRSLHVAKSHNTCCREWSMGNWRMRWMWEGRLMPWNLLVMGWDGVGLMSNWIWAVWWEHPQSGIGISSWPPCWPGDVALGPTTCTRTAHDQRIQGDIPAVRRENRHRNNSSYWQHFIMKLYQSGLWMWHRKVIYCSNFSSI